MISQVSFFQVRITGKQVTYPRLQGRRAAQAMHIKCLFLPGGFRYFGYSDLELGGRRVQWQHHVKAKAQKLQGCCKDAVKSASFLAFKVRRLRPKMAPVEAKTSEVLYLHHINTKPFTQLTQRFKHMVKNTIRMSTAPATWN